MPRPALAALASLSALTALTALATAVPTAHAAPHTAPNAEQQATATPSARGSIVFVRDHDIWIARADGAHARAITTDGHAGSAYASPSQADNGVIAAQRGSRIVRFDPAGAPLGSIDPLPLTNSLGHSMDGTPVDVAISPDGQHIAYSFTGFQCDRVAGCATRTATGVTRADVATDPREIAVSHRDAATWITTDRLLLGGGGGIDVHLQSLRGAESRWFGDSDTGEGGWDFEDLSDPTLSPDGRLLAAIRGYGDSTHVFWYDVPEDPRTTTAPATPTRKCRTDQTPTLGSPTFSAGGTLAFEAYGDIYATADPRDCASPIEVLVADARQPSFSDWTYSVPPPRDTPPAGTPADGPSAAAPANTAKPSIRGRTRTGKRLTAVAGTWSASPTTYAYQWLRQGRPVRGATGPGYVVKRADRGKRLSVRVTATGPGGSTTALSAPVRIRR